MFFLLMAAGLAAPDVFLISVDTLRADRLAAYGSTQGATPALDAFSKEARVFEDCVCEIPLTGPSFCAMMTSQYPRMLGVVQNGTPLADGVPTVAMTFRNAGYQTCCIQSNWPLRSYLCGLNRGFDRYDDGFEQERPGMPTGERYADEVTQLALEALQQRDPKRPLFLWVHYTDPHAPYRFHLDFNPGGRKLLGLDRTAQTRVKYDSEVAFADHHLGLFLSAIPKDNTFVVFVADHGESLFDHGYLGHGRRINQASMHVPLMIRGPALAPGRIAGPARGIDVGPTLLALAGLPPAPGMLGLNLLDPLPEERTRVIETYGGKRPENRRHGEYRSQNMAANASLLWQGVVSGEWKLVLSADINPRPQLFNLHDDPTEKSDLAAGEPARVRNLTAVIKKWNSEIVRGSPGKSNLSEEDMQVLRALGYLQ